MKLNMILALETPALNFSNAASYSAMLVYISHSSNTLGKGYASN